jgi:hypothetical protein
VPVANHLRGSALAEDLQRLTGLRVERRAEGVLLVDTANFSVERFPGTGSVAQVAVLLAVEMADRIVDPDGRRVKRFERPEQAGGQAELIALIDAGLPAASQAMLDPDGRTRADPDSQAAEDGDAQLPFIPDSFLRSAVSGILARYASAFGAQWHADAERLRVEAMNLLARFGCVIPTPGGVLVLPLTGRYRNTVAATKKRGSPAALF